MYDMYDLWSDSGKVHLLCGMLSGNSKFVWVIWTLMDPQTREEVWLYYDMLSIQVIASIWMVH